jgi:hypothetical protein
MVRSRAPRSNCHSVKPMARAIHGRIDRAGAAPDPLGGTLTEGTDHLDCSPLVPVERMMLAGIRIIPNTMPIRLGTELAPPARGHSVKLSLIRPPNVGSADGAPPLPTGRHPKLRAAPSPP